MLDSTIARVHLPSNKKYTSFSFVYFISAFICHIRYIYDCEPSILEVLSLYVNDFFLLAGLRNLAKVHTFIEFFKLIYMVAFVVIQSLVIHSHSCLCNVYVLSSGSNCSLRGDVSRYNIDHKCFRLNFC